MWLMFKLFILTLLISTVYTGCNTKHSKCCEIAKDLDIVDAVAKQEAINMALDAGFGMAENLIGGIPVVGPIAGAQMSLIGTYVNYFGFKSPATLNAEAIETVQGDVKKLTNCVNENVALISKRVESNYKELKDDIDDLESKVDKNKRKTTNSFVTTTKGETTAFVQTLKREIAYINEKCGKVEAICNLKNFKTAERSFSFQADAIISEMANQMTKTEDMIQNLRDDLKIYRRYGSQYRQMVQLAVSNYQIMVELFLMYWSSYMNTGAVLGLYQVNSKTAISIGGAQILSDAVSQLESITNLASRIAANKWRGHSFRTTMKQTWDIYKALAKMTDGASTFHSTYMWQSRHCRNQNKCDAQVQVGVEVQVGDLQVCGDGLITTKCDCDGTDCNVGNVCYMGDIFGVCASGITCEVADDPEFSTEKQCGDDDHNPSWKCPFWRGKKCGLWKADFDENKVYFGYCRSSNNICTRDGRCVPEYQYGRFNGGQQYNLGKGSCKPSPAKNMKPIMYHVERGSNYGPPTCENSSRNPVKKNCKCGTKAEWTICRTLVKDTRDNRRKPQYCYNDECKFYQDMRAEMDVGEGNDVFVSQDFTVGQKLFLFVGAFAGVGSLLLLCRKNKLPESYSLIEADTSEI